MITLNCRRVLRTFMAALLLLAGTVTSQQVVVAQSQVQRGVDAADRAQQRGGEAIERANAAQERAAAAAERAASVQERSAGAVEKASGALQRASNVSERTVNSPEAGARSTTQGRGRQSPLANESARYEELAQAHFETLEVLDGIAVVRGEIVAVDPREAVIGAARRAGYTLASEEIIEGIDLRLVTLRVPVGQSVGEALSKLREISGDTQFTANHIHLQSGTEPSKRASARLAASSPIAVPAIGLIDGGVADTPYNSRLMQRGFARGAPVPDAHATALASLVTGVGKVRSAAPGTPLLVADIYGSDPRGGSAISLARALGWMATQRVRVVVVGLVGPANPIVERAIQSLNAQGILIVASVGNAGAAAPPMYPAAYALVVGVTGVDRHNRALVEAGRGAHVDFAAPGADIRGATLNGNLTRLRGTSYAAPLVAGRLWQLRKTPNPVSALEHEAVDLGQSGLDRTYGHGLVCGTCR